MNNDKLKDQLQGFTKQLTRYRILLFILLLACVYGFLVFKINQLGNVKPSPTAVSAQTKTLNSPHVDQSTVQKITKLKDNSVTVQSLFDKARQNPFQE